MLPNAKVRMYLVYINTGPSILCPQWSNPIVLFHPNFSIKGCAGILVKQQNAFIVTFLEASSTLPAGFPCVGDLGLVAQQVWRYSPVHLQILGSLSVSNRYASLHLNQFVMLAVTHLLFSSVDSLDLFWLLCIPLSRDACRARQTADACVQRNQLGR